MNKITSVFEYNTNNNFVEIEYIDPPNTELYLLCKTYIPLGVLYKARTINIDIKLNVNAMIRFGLYDEMHTGPVWEYVGLNKNGSFSTLTYSLDKENYKKIEWLIRPYKFVPIFIKDFESTDRLVLTIKGIYLK